MDNIETVTASPMSLTDKNLYAYCDNNPVMRVDKGGEFWDIVFDVVSLAARVYDLHWYDWSAQADLQLRFSSKTKRMKLYLKYQYQPAATAKF